MEMKLQKRKELFECKMDKLIHDFSAKKKKYYSMYVLFNWIIIISNAGMAFSIGVSFIEEIALQFKVVSLGFSSVMLIFNGAMNFLNYRNLYEQRTLTLVNLLALKREYEFGAKYSDQKEELDEVFNKLQKILKDDLEIWIENTFKNNEEN